jgi:hypothetical protein
LDSACRSNTSQYEAAELKKQQAEARRTAIAALTAPGTGAPAPAPGVAVVTPIRMQPITPAAAAAFNAAAFGDQIARGAASP